MHAEIEKTKLLVEQREKEHVQKMEREEQRHKNIMEELAFMAKHKIKEYARFRVES